MANQRVRVVVEFTQDYETKKKGETMSVSRTLAHLLTNVAKVAVKVEETKEDGKTAVAKKSTAKK